MAHEQRISRKEKQHAWHSPLYTILKH